MIDKVSEAEKFAGLEARGLPARLAAGLAKEHLPSLDGVRAAAAFLVVFFHSGLPLPGSLGVLAFFVLSAFLITWLLLREEELLWPVVFILLGANRRRIRFLAWAIAATVAYREALAFCLSVASGLYIRGV